MPCPFFEPIEPLSNPCHPGARLALIREYDGLCHASGAPAQAPADMRFPYCNHGYSRSHCPSFPDAEHISCMRYAIRAEHATGFRILCIEECDHTPLRWVEVQFETASGAASGDVPPLVRAQAEAFGRSYVACGAPAK